MVAAPGMLLIAGKKLKEACAVPARFMCHCYPAQSIWLARRKGLQLLSLFLYSYLDRSSTGAEVGRFECFVFLFLASLSGILFLFFGTVIFWSF